MIEVYRVLALPVYLPSLFIATAQQGITILLPLFALQLDGGPEAAALVLGLRGVGTMLIAVPAGVLAARFGDRAVMSVSLALMALAAFGLAATGSILVMAILALCFGVASGAWMLARMSYITAASAPHERGRVVAVVAGIQRFRHACRPAGGWGVGCLVELRGCVRRRDGTSCNCVAPGGVFHAT